MKDESGDAIITRHLRNLAFDLNNGMSEKDALERMRERFNAEVDDDKIPFLTHRDRHFYELENRLKTATKNLKKALFATDDAEDNALALSSVKVSERATVDCLPGMMYQQLDGGDICYLSAWRNFKTAAEGFLQDKIGKCLLQGKGHAADQLRCAIAYIRHATVTTCHDRDDFRDSFIYALWLDHEATAEMNGETIDITEQPPTPTSISTEDLMQMMQKVKEEAHCARVAAELAANNSDAIRADLAGWRDYVKNLLDAGGENDADDKSSKKKRGKNLATYKPELGFAQTKAAIVKVWDDFCKGDADCEMPNGQLRKRGQGRSFAECIEQCGKTIIRNNQTLHDLLTIPECGKSPAEVFEKIVHSSRESTRTKAPTNDYSAKPPQKKKPK